MGKLINEVGNKYGKLLVISLSINACGPVKFVCLCDCGKTAEVIGANLRRGNSKSCGCVNRENVTKANTKHGHSTGYKRSRTYAIWSSMRARQEVGYCANVKVCDRWEKFENFLKDMGEAPPGLSLDRIDNSKGYEPANCRWVTMQVQQNNRTNNRLISYMGVVRTLAQWVADLNLNYKRVHARLKLGWSVEDAFNRVLQGPTVRNLTSFRD